MTESKYSRVLASGVLVVGLALASGCRMGLPPEPPGADATDPDAAIPSYQMSPDPFARSAFAGEDLSPGGGHAGHHRPASRASDEAVGEHNHKTEEPRP